MTPPTVLEVIEHGMEEGYDPRQCARFWMHGDRTDWTMKDGSPVQNWQSVLRCWMDRKRNFLDEKNKKNIHLNQKRVSISYEERRTREAEGVIREGRKRKVSDEQIGTVLNKRGLSWP